MSAVPRLNQAPLLRDPFRNQPAASLLAQWLEALERDYNHPCIVGWCPLNETHEMIEDRLTVLDEVTTALFRATKDADRTRPVLDVSGYAHRVAESDVYDSHDYSQDPAALQRNQAPLAEGKPYRNQADKPLSVAHRGQPYFVSEFGGIKWTAAEAGSDPERRGAWGYGEPPRDIETFHGRFAGLCHALLEMPDLFGFCYTQLTDVFQEQNGIYTFDRQDKFDMPRIAAAVTRPAAYEQRS